MLFQDGNAVIKKDIKISEAMVESSATDTSTNYETSENESDFTGSSMVSIISYLLFI